MSVNSLIDFYPTPKALITKLLDGIKFSEVGPILEPSAGKGDICDVIKKRVSSSRYHSSREAEIDCVEINADLRHVLAGKEYRVVHDDFLTFRTRKAYSLIIANFPFSEGDRHLDRALQLLEQHGGELRCLVNAETLRNPHTKLRMVLQTKLAALGAEIEYLAGEFESAERRTSVEVALIKVKAEQPERVSVLLDKLKRQAEARPDNVPRKPIPGGARSKHAFRKSFAS